MLPHAHVASVSSCNQAPELRASVGTLTKRLVRTLLFLKQQTEMKMVITGLLQLQAMISRLTDKIFLKL